MSDTLLAFMFLCMIVSPCLAARLVCVSASRAALDSQEAEPV